MTIYIDQDAVAKQLAWRDAIECLKKALADEAAGETFVSGKFAPAFKGSIRILFAADYAGGYGAMKAYHSFPGTGTRYLITLIDLNSGELLAIVDGRRITDMRTAAASGIAAAALGFGDRPELALLGSGRQARAQLRCLHAVVDLDKVTVYSPTEANRTRFAEELGAELGLDIVPAASAEVAVRGRPLVLTATRTRQSEPILSADWLTDCRLLMAVGNTRAQFKEIDPRCCEAAALVVVDSDHALDEAGELAEARAAGLLPDEKVRLLASLAASDAALPASGMIVFKSVGTGLQDLALAARCYETMKDAPGVVRFADLANAG